VNDSMPADRAEEKRYAHAVWFAVDQKDVGLGLADQFGGWHASVGWVLHGDDLAASFAHWSKPPDTAQQNNQA
jgi:hypothetical protein